MSYCRFVVLGLVAVLAGLMADRRGTAAVVTIDAFSGTQGPVVVTGSPSGTKTGFSTLITGAALGGERDFLITRTSANIGTVTGDVGVASVGAFSLGTVLTTTATGLLKYDGVNGTSTLNPTGLGGLDFTAAVFSGSFRADMIGGSITFTVYTDATRFSTATLAIPASGVLVPYSIPFGSFTPAGPGGGANFSSVGAVTVLVNSGTGAGGGGADISIGPIQVTTTPAAAVVPEPASFLVFGASLLGLFLYRRHGRTFRKNRHARLTHSTDVF